MEIRTHRGCLNARGTVVCFRRAKRWEKWAPIPGHVILFSGCCLLLCSYHSGSRRESETVDKASNNQKETRK